MSEAELLEKLKANPQDLQLRESYLRAIELAGGRAEYVRLYLKRQQLQRELSSVEWELELRRYAVSDEWLDLVFPLDIRSTTVGVFYTIRAPNGPPYVVPGDVVEPATIVGKIEAMKIFSDLLADVRGVVTEVCVTNGQPVEYNQLLFKVGRPPRPIHGG